MRTTLDIDDDVAIAIKERARREHRTAGAVISDLARQALTGGNPPDEDDEYSFLGFHPLPPRGGVVTNDLIDSIREEEGV